MASRDPIAAWHATQAAERDARRAAVRAALAAHGGRLRPAALALGVAHGTLARWLATDPALADGVDLRAPGRPRMAP